MDIRRLCKGLGLADEVEREILACEQAIHYEEMEEPMERLFSPDTWEQGIRETEGVLGEDPRGMKMLAVCLRCLQKTYRLYEEKGICEKVFWDTMGFIPRFLEAHRAQHGVYAFTWAWWLPRQISLHEFRIGEFEYEFARDGKKPVIWIHIPADARLAQGEIAGIYPFAQTYFPEYGDAPIRCASWMLVPALGEILPEDSRILQFQSRFDVTEVEEDNPAFMDWIYSCRTEDYASLPERTSLQKGVKKRLLDGGRIGWATGTYVGARPACLAGRQHSAVLSEQFVFRDILPEEADQAAEVEQICFPPNEACAPEMMRRRAAVAPEFFLVAVDRETGKIAGFLNGLATNERTLRDDFFRDAGLHDPEGENVMLLGLDVLPVYRRQGLATEIMLRYLEREWKRGRKLVVLTCLEGKVGMYEKMGYRDHGISQSSWGGEQWHEMSCRLHGV